MLDKVDVCADFQTYWDRQIDRLEAEGLGPWVMNKLWEECEKAFEDARSAEEVGSLKPGPTVRELMCTVASLKQQLDCFDDVLVQTQRERDALREKVKRISEIYYSLPPQIRLNSYPLDYYLMTLARELEG